MPDDRYEGAETAVRPSPTTDVKPPKGIDPGEFDDVKTNKANYKGR